MCLLLCPSSGTFQNSNYPRLAAIGIATSPLVGGSTAALRAPEVQLLPGRDPPPLSFPPPSVPSSAPTQWCSIERLIGNESARSSQSAIINREGSSLHFFFHVFVKQAQIRIASHLLSKEPVANAIDIIVALQSPKISIIETCKRLISLFSSIS